MAAEIRISDRWRWAATVPVKSSIQRLILLVVAEAADGKVLTCRLSKKTVAKRAGCSQATLYRHVAILADLGLLHSRPHHGKSTFWVIPPDAVRAFLAEAKAEREQAKAAPFSHSEKIDTQSSDPDDAAFSQSENEFSQSENEFSQNENVTSQSERQTGLRTGDKQVLITGGAASVDAAKEEGTVFSQKRGPKKAKTVDEGSEGRPAPVEVEPTPEEEQEAREAHIAGKVEMLLEVWRERNGKTLQLYLDAYQAKGDLETEALRRFEKEVGLSTPAVNGNGNHTGDPHPTHH